MYENEINEALNLKVMVEVERRAREWLTAAQGADWVRLFEMKSKELESLKSQLASLKNHGNILARAAEPFARVAVDGLQISDDQRSLIQALDEWKMHHG